MGSTDAQYQEHAQSVHGKMRVERDDGEVRIECTGGVKVERSGVSGLVGLLTI